MDSSKVNAAKRLFINLAAEECPGFIVRPEMRQALSDLVRWAVSDYSGRLDPDRGLWLWGSIGTGKSTLMAIMRRLCEHVRPRPLHRNFFWYPITNVCDVCADYQRQGYDGLATYVENDRQAFDEVGAETIPTAHYGSAENVMQYVLQRRYDRRRGSFTFVTTNLLPTQIAAIYGPRIYDRCKEMFNFVEVAGNTFRQLAS